MIKVRKNVETCKTAKHDNIKMPNYGIMIVKCNTVIKTVTGTVTVLRSASTG